MSYVGMTQDCLQHFSEQNGFGLSADSVYVKRNEISKLLRVGTQAGYHWFGKFIMPKGENLVRLRYFLELNGYGLQECQSMVTAVRELAGQIATGAVLIEEVAQCFGTRADRVLDIILGRDSASAERVVEASRLVDKYKEEAVRLRDEWKAVIARLQLVQAQSELVFPVATEVGEAKIVPQQEDRQPSGHDEVLKSLSHLILGMIPLVEHVLSDDFSPEERNRLREMCKTGRVSGVFELSNLVNRLCGETVRREMPCFGHR